MLFYLQKWPSLLQGNLMKNRLIFLSFITSITHINAMIINNTHDYALLPPEIQFNIILFATDKTSIKKPKEATKIVSTLTQINKQFNIDINDPKFSDNIIKNFAHKYRCSHETIARYLHTYQTQKRLALQYELKQLCCRKEDDNLFLKLGKLLTDNIDLEFTYSHYAEHKTPLMIAMNYNNNMFEYLLNYGANINGCNTHGNTALHLAASDPINEHYCILLITNPTIAINQQNKRGESALLRSLTHKKGSSNRTFTTIIKNFLNYGTDPELTDKKGLTPLAAAKKLRKKYKIIELIKAAIRQKHAVIQ
jgi:hypothetical protein